MAEEKRSEQKTSATGRVEKRATPNVPHISSMYPVTDLKYYMDGYLRNNLDEVPKFLKKAWDCVIIISGSGKVRIGKSTLAIQIAYYESWLINEIKKKAGEVPQDNQVPFGVDNIAFDPDELMKIAEKLPRNSVIVYDEGRAGLDSARAMENINKAMQDFFQECGQYGHIIIIVLPDFFKLQETIAVPRSLFLVNVYTDRNYNRGFFSFFSEHKKELLYIYGKKQYGSTAKYLSVKDNFHGKFTDYFPIDYELYSEKKRKALQKKRKNRLEAKWRSERDALFHYLNTIIKKSEKEIADIMNYYPWLKMSVPTVQFAVTSVKKKLDQPLFNKNDE